MRGSRLAAQQKHFFCELKKIREEKDNKCSMRLKPAYTEENTTENLCSAEETKNIKAA